MRTTKTAYLGIGSNIGDRWAHLQAAVDQLHAEAGIWVTTVSPVYETEAHTKSPTEEQPPFLNAVVEARVGEAPERLLRRAKAIERTEGRDDKGEEWAPRPLDVDLLEVGGTTCNTDHLILPHPRLAERRFVLRPWADVAPNHVVPPPFEASVQDLLDACTDVASVRRLSGSLDAPSSGDGTPANEL